jgi:hypothetical protein
LIGGLFLIIPIVVLSVLSNSRKWSLVATSLFVVFFAISLAIATKANNQELMAATAAYAAVLVVFVGVGQQGSSN